MKCIVIDPQEGWARRGTRENFNQLATFLLKNSLWGNTVITCFRNSDDSVFRQQLSWWNGFKEEPDFSLLEGFNISGVPMFWRGTYGLPKSLWEYLEEEHDGDLLITGVETDASVLSAAMQAFDLGYSVWIVSALVASTYGSAGQGHGLAILRKVLGKDHVVSMSKALELLSTS